MAAPVAEQPSDRQDGNDDESQLEDCLTSRHHREAPSLIRTQLLQHASPALEKPMQSQHQQHGGCY